MRNHALLSLPTGEAHYGSWRKEKATDFPKEADGFVLRRATVVVLLQVYRSTTAGASANWYTELAAKL
jgi:hypothetical protein